MSAADWPAVARIYAAGIAGGNATFEHTVPGWEQWSAARLPEPCLVARTSSDEAIGWAALSATSARPVYRGVGAVSIYVDPEHAGRGVGRVLLNALVGASERAGMWTLEAGIFPENVASIALHERCGFQLVGTRRRVGQMQDGRWRDVLLYERAARSSDARASTVFADAYAAEMARAQSHYVCSQCGSPSAQWHGQCPGCEAWNTLVEERGQARAEGGSRRPGIASARRRGKADDPRSAPRPLAEVGAGPLARLSTGIGELDRVLGGGLVPGSLVLLGGSPGIGKSTLTNMVLGHLAHAGRRTLYVSAEESAEQVRLRAERLGPGALQVPILAETDLEAILQTLAGEAPEVCVIDSVQTLHCAQMSGAPGSVGQVREVASAVMELAKSRGIAVILVGHVTKDGALAGPRVLEHLVDCVLQFEGERERPYRELRALKNRFGSTNEAGLFEMRQGGLVEVLDASARFVAEATRAPGSVVLAAMEGSRPLLVEVQALVAPSELEQPRRVVSGLDRNRLALVLAILGRHGRVGTGGADVFVNVVGGVRVDEPGVDLAIALAVASAARGVPLRGTPRACFGELGLTGELRWVGHPERRLEEADRHGLLEVVAPAGAGGGAREAGTLREALAEVLPAADRSLARAAA